MKGVINMLNKKHKRTIELVTKMLNESSEEYKRYADELKTETDLTVKHYYEKKMKYYRGQVDCLSRLLLLIT